jgi:hypothetical protein
MSSKLSTCFPSGHLLDAVCFLFLLTGFEFSMQSQCAYIRASFRTSILVGVEHNFLVKVCSVLPSLSLLASRRFQIKVQSAAFGDSPRFARRLVDHEADAMCEKRMF